MIKIFSCFESISFEQRKEKHICLDNKDLTLEDYQGILIFDEYFIAHLEAEDGSLR